MYNLGDIVRFKTSNAYMGQDSFLGKIALICAPKPHSSAIAITIYGVEQIPENNIPKLPVCSWTCPITQDDIDVFNSDAFYDYTYVKNIVGKDIILWLGESRLSLNTTTPKTIVNTDDVVVKPDPVIVEDEEDHGGFKLI
jgi:hypothetical protein